MSGTDEQPKTSRASAFRRLRLGGARKIPFIAQLTPTDCGAASLSMALAYHGKDVPIHAVRGILGGGRNGVTAKQILLAARSYGFRARGVGVDLDTLQYLSPGSILHWELVHFVVFERCDKKNLYIVDPGLGRRRIPMSEAGKSLTGVAILLEPSETFSAEKSERKGRYKRYIDWMMGARDIWMRVLLVSIFMQLLALAVPALMGSIVDKVVPRADFQLLYLVGAGCISMASFEFLSTFLRSRLLLHLRTQIEARMSLDFVEHLLALPYAFFQQRTTGDLMMRMSSQAAIRDLMTTGALSTLLDGVLVIVYFILLLGAAPILAAVAGVVAFLQIVVVIMAARRSADLMTEGLAVQAQLASFQVEMLGGMETIKSMGAGPRATSRWTDLYVDVLNTSLARGRLDGTYGGIMGTLGFAGPIALLLTGAYQVLEGKLSVGIMLGLSALGSGFLGPVASLVGTAMSLSQVKSYLARIEDVLDAPIEPTRPNPLTAGRPISGRIEVRNLSFFYPGEQTPTLTDVSFDIGSGECVAIVGSSGSGKSTLARLLAGLYVPASGNIAFDGSDMATLDLTHLRDRLGIVTQDTRLFSGTLRDNVTLFEPGVPQDAIEAACELACLHPDIMRMPMAYDTMLADGGTSLSGGQRQRLSLARALLRRPNILILDEATSALDTVTEQRVQEHLRALACTRVLVAHRLSTIIESDKIVVLEQGRLVDVGRHVDLLQRCPQYHALIYAQHSPQGSAVQPPAPAPAVVVAQPNTVLQSQAAAPQAAVAPQASPPLPNPSYRPAPATIRPAVPSAPPPVQASPSARPPQRESAATLTGFERRAVQPTPPPRPSTPAQKMPNANDGLRARLAAKGGLDRTEPLELARRKTGEE